MTFGGKSSCLAPVRVSSLSTTPSKAFKCSSIASWSTEMQNWLIFHWYVTFGRFSAGVSIEIYTKTNICWVTPQSLEQSIMNDLQKILLFDNMAICQYGNQESASTLCRAGLMTLINSCLSSQRSWKSRIEYQNYNFIQLQFTRNSIHIRL